MNFQLEVAPYALGVTLVLFAILAIAIFIQVNKIESELSELLEGESTMATTLAQLAAVIAAETTENATLLSAVTQLDTDVNALVAKVQSGQDFTNELNAVNANLATITGVVGDAQAEDAAVNAANPPAAPPA